MTSYVEIQSNPQSAGASYLHLGWRRIGAWLAPRRDARSRKKTEYLLGRLDRSVLEDIGVPHHNVSRRAGVLDRYPHVITVNTRGW